MQRIRTLALLAFAAMAPTVISAQSLEDELSVLDDLPEADLSDVAPSVADAVPAPDVAPTPDASVDSAIADASSAEEESLQQELAQLSEETEEQLQQQEQQEQEQKFAESEATLVIEPTEQVAETPTPPADNLESIAPPAALTGIDQEAIAYMTAMDFQQLPDRVRLRLKTDRGIDYEVSDRADRRQVVLELQNTNIANKLLKRALDTGDFDGPVALIKAYESKAGATPSVKVLFQLRDFQKAQITRAGSDLLVDFPIQNKSGKLFEIASDIPVLPETILSSFDKMKFSGAKMNIRVKDAPLADVLALISRASGQDFVLAQESNQKVTIQMNDAPWDQVLAMILLNSSMGYQKIGKVYRIASSEALRKELDSAVASEAKKKELATLETRIFPINYAKASDLNAIVQKFLTKDRGNSSVEERTNSIVMTDLGDVLDRVAAYLKKVDLQTPQVLIEARIVQADDNLEKEFNLRFGIDGDAGTGGTWNFNVGTDGPGSARAKGGLLVSGATLPGIGAISALLNMYESQSQTKIISSPRVMTLNNQKAVIADGLEVRVLVPATADSPETTTFKKVELRLEALPSITTDGFVRMEISLRKDDVTSTEGQFSTKEVNTTLMVESGKTAVIGGVYIDSDVEKEDRLSYLGSLPVLGKLFTPLQTRTTIKKELLMFISPKILNADRSTLISTGTTNQASF